MCSYTDAAVDEAPAEACRFEMRILLSAGHLDAPDLLPGLVELHVDGIDARVVRSHCVTHVCGDAMFLRGEKTAEKTYGQMRSVY